ncbi:hypothetical protein SAY86_006491 [Trapa natans]|uniref:Uncharacterized protein n=1 Tax=Trapa natans TaxID=22666 RepID=A0AAN7KYY1_TRANT|nr:hypothetical protein SAY86_006491 [Trapa natans]
MFHESFTERYLSTTKCLTHDWIRSDTICQRFIQGLNRSVSCILNGMGCDTDIEDTIHIAYECERIVENPPPQDHVQNIKDMEEEDEDDEESNTSQNH